MATLHRAVALKKMHGVALSVRQHLNLHVPGANDGLLKIDGVIAEGARSFGPGAFVCLDEIFGPLHKPHALSTATSGGLEHDGIADLFCRLEERVSVAGIRTGNNRHAGSDHLLARGGLTAHGLHRLGARSDKDDARSATRPDKVGVLAEEPISRVNGLGAATLGHIEDALGHQIALRACRATDTIGFVGHADMKGFPVRFGVHRDAANAHLAQGSHHPDSDLSTVGHQDLAKTFRRSGGGGVGSGSCGRFYRHGREAATVPQQSQGRSDRSASGTLAARQPT